jgi:hypothetical protein
MAGWGPKLVIGLMALTTLFGSGRAAAAEEPVRVCVIAILATKRDDKVDPRLKCIAKELRKMHPELTGFRLARDDGMSCQSVTVGTRKVFKLPENESATVTVHHGADKENRVEVKVRPPRMKAITYESPCGKFLPIVTPVRTKDGDLLIIGVRVTPCHDD